jgi:hypothetical protein
MVAGLSLVLRAAVTCNLNVKGYKCSMWRREGLLPLGGRGAMLGLIRKGKGGPEYAELPRHFVE